jgi:hypothetical protein
MDDLEQVKSWIETVQQHLPVLSKPQAVVLALWSFGIVVMQSCGLTTVTAFLAALLQCKEDAMRQRLREWCRAENDKKGEKRRELDVTACFAPLLRWVLSWWPEDEKRIALAIDATTLADRFVVLAVSVVYRGCGLPVAWIVLQGNTKAAWKPHWLALLAHVKDSIPDAWCVVVTGDRGLYARWLYRAIVNNGWHPFLRINLGAKCRPEGAHVFRWIKELIPAPGSHWSGRVTCFKGKPLECTLLACWGEEHQEPWLILTDIAPEQADVLWYSLRPWIECGFRHTKRGGWRWNRCRMTDPKRATRLWLAIAVATLWCVSVGGEADATCKVSTLDALPELHIARRRATGRSRFRRLSCLRQGIIIILVALITGQPLPLGCFLPEPWPSSSFVNDTS